MAHRLTDYTHMLRGLLAKGYRIGAVRDYFERVEPPCVFLRHDVDRLVFRAVNMAAAERDLGVRATYYFRCNAAMRFPEQAIRRTAEMGHEVGFHYETVVRMKGVATDVLRRFSEELAALRRIAVVTTATAHGSPLSKLSNMGYTRSLDLAQFGLAGDPAISIDFNRALYASDTGGTYGSRHNYRDWSDGRNLASAMSPVELADWLDPGREPVVVISSHPERWATTSTGLWQARATDALVNLLKFAVNRGRGTTHHRTAEAHAT